MKVYWIECRNQPVIDKAVFATFYSLRGSRAEQLQVFRQNTFYRSSRESILMGKLNLHSLRKTICRCITTLVWRDQVRSLLIGMSRIWNCQPSLQQLRSPSVSGTSSHHCRFSWHCACHYSHGCTGRRARDWVHSISIAGLGGGNNMTNFNWPSLLMRKFRSQLQMEATRPSSRSSDELIQNYDVGGCAVFDE